MPPVDDVKKRFGTSGHTQGARIAEAILGLISRVPRSRQQELPEPAARIRVIADRAAARAAVTAGGLAVPPGPLGWLTVLPELVAVWTLQAQMVADIAATCGKEASLTREHMLYCLYRHTAAQAVRDLAVRVGERVLVHRVSLSVLQSVAGAVGYRITGHAVGRGVARWLPVVGAIGVGAYAYYDTRQVARTVIDLLEREIGIESIAMIG